MLNLAKEIIDGRHLTREDDLSMLLNADLGELTKGADMIQKVLCSQSVNETNPVISHNHILGQGENWKNRLDMALELADSNISFISLQFITPFLETQEIIRIIAIFRYINPSAFFRLGTVRNL